HHLLRLVILAEEEPEQKVDQKDREDRIMSKKIEHGSTPFCEKRRYHQPQTASTPCKVSSESKRRQEPGADCRVIVDLFTVRLSVIYSSPISFAITVRNALITRHSSVNSISYTVSFICMEPSRPAALQRIVACMNAESDLPVRI